MINTEALFDALSDLTDELQRQRQMLAALCRRTGIDPDEAQRLPGEELTGAVAGDEL